MTDSLTRASVWLYHGSRTAATSGSSAIVSSGPNRTFRCVAYGNADAGGVAVGSGIGKVGERDEGLQRRDHPAVGPRQGTTSSSCAAKTASQTGRASGWANATV